MKQFIFSLVLISTFIFNADAQMPRSDVYILNQTECYVTVTSVKYACIGNCFPNGRFINIAPNGVGNPCTSVPQCAFGEETQIFASNGTSSYGYWEDPSQIQCLDYVPVAFEVQDINNNTYWVWEFSCGTSAVSIDIGCPMPVTAEFKFISSTTGGLGTYILHVHY